MYHLCSIYSLHFVPRVESVYPISNSVARVMPIMLGSKVSEDDDHWCNFLLMLEITGTRVD